MNNGWICLHRKLTDWEWYSDINTCRLFIHCLLRANHKPNTWRGIDIPAGSFITGRKVLAEETGLSEQQIRTCLKKLKSTNDLTIKATNKNSLVTVMNWESHQSKGAVATSKTTSDQPNEQPTSNHKQQCNKLTSNTPDKPKYDETDLKFAKWMLKIINERLPNFKKPNIDNWAKTVRLMRVQDKREYQEMSDIWLWARDDEFWQGNVLSADKFRKQYDMLLSQSLTKQQKVF